MPKEGKNFFPHPHTKDGLEGICRACRAIRSRELYQIHRLDPEWVARKRAVGKIWEQKNREKIRVKQRRNYTKEKGRKYNLRCVYRLEPNDYQRLLAKQEGLCCICEKGAIRLVVDHNHATGEVRGLLCYRCNGLVGMIERAEPLKPKILKYLSENGFHDSAQ